ncbi:MAG: hypothetical protein IKV53_05375 [Clostridia bacterium]|nr:hypothetical protein [Clostridia bacterium]
MKLVNNFKFDIKDIYGDIVIVYPKGSADVVDNIRESLDRSCYCYNCRQLGGGVFNRDSVDEIISLLNKCNCFIPVITNSLMLKENALFRAVLWYLVGYMKSLPRGVIVPFVYEPEGEELLMKTPLKNTQFFSDVGALQSTIKNRFSSRLLRKNYYENIAVNTYASRRIVYHCLRLHFDIREQSFRNAKELYSDYTSRRITDEAFDAYIENCINCGCKVVSFGNPDALTPPMAVYCDEVTPKIEDYTDSIAGKRLYKKNSAEIISETGIRAELEVDIIIPVHKILGAYVKCYLECSDADADVTVLLSLMEGDFVEKISECDLDLLDDVEYWEKIYPEGVCVNRNRRRFYFDLGIERRSDSLVPDPSLNIGDRLDFIFPQ